MMKEKIQKVTIHETFQENRDTGIENVLLK